MRTNTIVEHAGRVKVKIDKPAVENIGRVKVKIDKPAGKKTVDTANRDAIRSLVRGIAIVAASIQNDLGSDELRYWVSVLDGMAGAAEHFAAKM